MRSTAYVQLLRAQDGIISRPQAVDLGFTRRQIDGRLADGEWTRYLPGVFCHQAVALTPEAEVRAGSLWLGGAPLLGVGAGWWWGLVAEPPDHWEYLVPADGTVSRRPRFRARRCFVDPDDLTTRRGLPVLSCALAALRTAERLEVRRKGHGAALLDRLKQRELVTASDLEAAFRRNCGTWGTKTMRALLVQTRGHARSELERMAGVLLREAGISGYVLNHRTRLTSGRPVELDLAFLGIKLAIELDGFAFHAGPDEHRADLGRANDLMADGWTIRRFTYWDLVNDPAGFVRTVREALRQLTPAA